MANRSLAAVTLVVADYDEAIAWYVDKLGFALIEDIDLGAGKRWVTISASPLLPGGNGAEQGSKLLLARAEGMSSGEASAQRAAIGNQTGGRVAFFLHTDDFARDHAAMLVSGVEFKEQPRYEPYGTVAIFADLYGNLWDLIEPKR